MDDERVIHSNFLNFNRYNDLYLFVLGFQPFGPILASFPLLAISTHRTHRAFKSTLYRYTPTLVDSDTNSNFSMCHNMNTFLPATASARLRSSHSHILLPSGSHS